MFEIVGKYRGRSEWELIDFFEDQNEAIEMLGEYMIAFGHDWSLKIREAV